MRLPFLAGCLAMLAAAPAIAQTVPAQAVPAETVPAAPDALVDRFMAALPHQEEFLRPHSEDAELARLEQLNAGHAKEVRAIVAAHQTCLAPVVKDTTVRVLRTLAAGLGEARLDKLIGFYTGPDGRRLEQLADKADRGQKPSAAEEQELARIMAAYPLGDWARALRHSGEVVADDPGFLAATARCDGEKAAALDRAHLHN